VSPRCVSTGFRVQWCRFARNCDRRRSRARFEQLARRLDIVIPEEPLWEPYAGVWDPAVFGPSEPTWWIRYFDYL
jgi:hypothetical protein